MNLPYFYEEEIRAPLHVLSEETSKHCVQVLRMKSGEQLQITDGSGNLFTATITNADKKHCEIRIETTENHNSPATNISIAISLLKNPSRFEWFLEKAMEIGVSEITPLICDRTEQKHFRYERMNGILISAMLQSRQTWLCDLHQPEKFNQVVNRTFADMKFIAHCAEGTKRNLVELTPGSNHALILIGPEGDFSAAEIQAAIEKNFTPVSLGDTRLRSETAGMVSAALLCNRSP
jgi:16S rRNA (uracil1498-N3)-methyltransferase